MPAATPTNPSVAATITTVAGRSSGGEDKAVPSPTNAAMTTTASAPSSAPATPASSVIASVSARNCAKIAPFVDT